MKLWSLLYISRSTIAAQDADASVDSIVQASRANNPGLGLTGALLFTGEHFAQVLEGTCATIDTLMAVVEEDRRHDRIIATARHPIDVRRFGRWSMAYSGPSQFVSRHVTQLLVHPAPPDQARLTQWLTSLMWEFSEGPGSV